MSKTTTEMQLVDIAKLVPYINNGGVFQCAGNASHNLMGRPERTGNKGL